MRFKQKSVSLVELKIIIVPSNQRQGIFVSIIQSSDETVYKSIGKNNGNSKIIQK